MDSINFIIDENKNSNSNDKKNIPLIKDSKINLYINNENTNLEFKKNKLSKINQISLELENMIKDDYFSKDEIDNYNHFLKEEGNININQEFLINHIIRKGDLIGEGGFSKVYKAFDENLGKIVAVKELKIGSIDTSKNRLVSVEKEIEILSKMNHLNIVKYYGTYYSEKGMSIILEYCAGGSLSNLISQYKKLDERLIRRYLKQILLGLEYLHYHNIIHRDIKGANILVDKDGICKLSDFGGSKLVSNEQDSYKSNIFRGTPNWMAPESVKKLEYTRYSDIWGIGCLCIEMSSGEPPWNNYKNPMAVLFQLYNNPSPPPIPTSISILFKDFINCCLQLEPIKRLNVSSLLKHQFITGNVSSENLRIVKSTYPNSVGSSNSSNKSKLSSLCEYLNE